MTTSPDVPEAEAEKLLRLMMDADGGQPFMTHKAAAALGVFIISELGRIAHQMEDAPSVKLEWGSPSDVAKIYGCHRTTAARRCVAWAAAGKVRVSCFRNEVTGAMGHKLYNLADIERCMMENAATTEREKESA